MAELAQSSSSAPDKISENLPVDAITLYLENELVQKRHGGYRNAVETLVTVMKGLDPEANFSVIHFGEGVTLADSPKVTSYRSVVQQQVSMIVLRDNMPVIDVWDNGATWDISAYQSQGKRELLDFSPTNLIRECFGKKIAEFSAKLKAHE